MTVCGVTVCPFSRDKGIQRPKCLCQESCRTKVSRIFRIFVPNFAPNFAPNFPRIFRGLFVLRLVGDGDQKKFTQNPRHFSTQNSQPNTKKIFTKFFWRVGKVTNAFKTRLKYTCHEIALSVTRQTCTWNCPGGVRKELRLVELRADFCQKSLGVHKILVRKIWFPPPPRKGPKMRKNCRNQYKILKIDTFSVGETRFYGQNDFMDIWAFLILLGGEIWA